MAFEKGFSGNPSGRPKGAGNKTTFQLREMITGFLENHFEAVVRDFGDLQPRERVKLYCDLLQYGLPKLQTVQLESEFDTLSDCQLQTIIDRLKNDNND